MNVKSLKWISSSLILILNASLLMVSFQNCSASGSVAAAQGIASSGPSVTKTESAPRTAEENLSPLFEQQ